MEDVPVPAFTPDFEDWLRGERTWALRALALSARMRASAPRGGGGLDRFAARMGLVELTGEVASWAANVAAGLEKHGRPGAAAAFHVEPPFSEADEGENAHVGLSDYLELRKAALDELLGEAAGERATDAPQ